MNQEQLSLKLKRYSRGLDDLLRTEIEKLYYSSNEEKRIEITEMFNTKSELYMPDEWVEMTLKDGNENELIALAKYTKYPKVTNISQEHTGEKGNKLILQKPMVDILLEKGGLIKCALYENENFLSPMHLFDADNNFDIQFFIKANCIERLALIRNPLIGFTVLKGIFSPGDNVFDLTDEQRKDLVTAFCQNNGHREKFKQALKDYGELWDLSLNWILPRTLDRPNSELAKFIVYSIFHFCPCRDDKMLEIYQKLSKSQAELNTYARESILEKIESLPPEERKRKTLSPLLKEGANDYNDECRNLAVSLLTDNDWPEDKTAKLFSRIAMAWGYVWTVIVNLIILAVLFIVFSAGETKFEMIVIVILALIYLTASSSFAIWGYLRMAQWDEDYRRSKHLRKLLNEQLNYQEKEAEAEAYEEIKKNFRNNTIKFWINQGFNFIFYLITIVNLLRVTVFSSY